MSRDVTRGILRAWLAPRFRHVNPALNDQQIESEIENLLNELDRRGVGATPTIVQSIIRKRFPNFTARGEGA